MTTPGRAYTPGQKRAIIEKLYKIWLDAPTLRFGQLMYIVGGSSRDPTFFYMEDEQLIAKLEKHIIPPTKKRSGFDFEQAMRELEQSAGPSSEDVAALSEAILRLAESDDQP